MIRVAAALGLASVACAPRGSLGHEMPAATGSGTDTAAGSGSEASESSAAASAGDATGTAADSSTAAADTGSSTAHAGACEPAVDDMACATCRKAMCCEELTACAGDELCTCIAGCISDGGDLPGCETHCAGSSPTWTHLHDCEASSCAADC